MTILEPLIPSTVQLTVCWCLVAPLIPTRFTVEHSLYYVITLFSLIHFMINTHNSNVFSFPWQSLFIMNTTIRTLFLAWHTTGHSYFFYHTTRSLHHKNNLRISTFLFSLREHNSIHFPYNTFCSFTHHRTLFFQNHTTRSLLHKNNLRTSTIQLNTILSFPHKETLFFISQHAHDEALLFLLPHKTHPVVFHNTHTTTSSCFFLSHTMFLEHTYSWRLWIW